ncbi:hypothetical protein AB0K74_37325 [Streptomyces sp. NPDC056159]|uniref:hypothetical protein n=1 Tax=unclassified Streptomyces TaxID=2593676 RepID=UPI0034144CCF
MDTSTGCFIEAAATGRLTGGENTVPDDDSADGILVLDNPESGGNLIVYPSGMGNSSYPRGPAGTPTPRSRASSPTC